MVKYWVDFTVVFSQKIINSSVVSKQNYVNDTEDMRFTEKAS